MTSEPADRAPAPARGPADPEPAGLPISAGRRAGSGSSTPDLREATPERETGAARDVRRGTVFGLAAYLLWGTFPFYFHALAPAGPWEIVAHRILWSFVFCLAVLLVRRELGWLPALAREGRIVAGLAVAACVVAVNWGVYVGAVLGGHTRDAALGYFLNPLITVALGVLVLREPLRRLQAVAVAIGGLAAAYLSVVGGSVPLIALTLATSFAIYGLVKKRVGANLPALHGLAVETAVLAPVAGLLLGPLSGAFGAASAGWISPGHAALLVLSGPVTAIPLLLFAAAARRVPLVTIGLLQFSTPVLQLLASLVLGEQVGGHEWVGFCIVWVALAVLTTDAVRARGSA